ARADVELPGMPGTADDLTGSRILILAWLGGRDGACEFAARQAPALVRALVGECEEFALDVENDDVASRHVHQLARPRRDLGGCGDDVAGHGWCCGVGRLELTLGGSRNGVGLSTPRLCGGMKALSEPIHGEAVTREDLAMSFLG